MIVGFRKLINWLPRIYLNILIWKISTLPTHTHSQGYEPIIFYPKRTSKEIYHILVAQCEKLNIPFIDKLPAATELDSEYHVIVDALFGFSFRGTPRSPFDAVLATLKQIKKPLAAVDIPSGTQLASFPGRVGAWERG